MNKLAAYVHVAAVLALLVIFVGANAVAADGNGTTISDGLLSDEEFLMESETGRRILAGLTKPGYSYPALGKDARNCNGGNNPSASCDPNQNKINSPGRGCRYKNLCRNK